MKNGESILAVDPGGTTGLAWCSLDRAFGVGYEPLRGPGTRDDRYVRLFDWGQIEGPVDVQMEQLIRGMRRLRVRILVWESSDHFLLRPREGSMRKYALIPIKMDGAMSSLIRQMDPVVVGVRQQPGQAKGVISREVLDAFGMVKGAVSASSGIALSDKGAGRHATDALRHLLLFLRRMYGSAGTKGGFAETIAFELGRKIE